tara:strand:+ start:35143 stop:35727 length:585 start_codon:yes stop_codon:yes gene_type:complete
MRIDEVIVKEISQQQQDALKQMRDIHVQRRMKGIGTDTSTYGSQIGQSVGTDVEVGDLTNVARQGTKDTDIAKQDTKKSVGNKDTSKQATDVTPTSAQLRRDAQTQTLRGKSRGMSRSDEPGGGRVGADGRNLKHQRYYSDQPSDLQDYDSILPDFINLNKMGKSAKKYASNFVRDPSKTMADLRYKFKDLLQK